MKKKKDAKVRLITSDDASKIRGGSGPTIADTANSDDPTNHVLD